MNDNKAGSANTISVYGASDPSTIGAAAKINGSNQSPQSKIENEKQEVDIAAAAAASAVDEDDDDDEYEVEYVYEDDDEAEVEDDSNHHHHVIANAMLKVDNNDNERKEPIYEMEEEGGEGEEDGEEGEEVEYEADEDEAEEEDFGDEKEFDRIANKIDELLNKTSGINRSPQQQQSPQQSLPPEQQQQPQQQSQQPQQHLNDAKKSEPTPIITDAPDGDETFAPPSALRHVDNRWNISNLRDEDVILTRDDAIDSDNEAIDGDASSHLPAASVEIAANLSAIKEDEEEEEEEEEENEKNECKNLTASAAGVRFGTVPQSLSDAIADEDELNEIEIALEDWRADDEDRKYSVMADFGDDDDDEMEGEGDGEGEGEEMMEEAEIVYDEDDDDDDQDDSDRVDAAMPDNLLLHANDQIAEALEEIERCELSMKPAESTNPPLSSSSSSSPPPPLLLQQQNEDESKKSLSHKTDAKLAEVTNDIVETEVEKVESFNRLARKDEFHQLSSSSSSSLGASYLDAPSSGPIRTIMPAPVAPPRPRRQLSAAEIEARKEEAREIVINAIDAALARDMSRLIAGAANVGISASIPVADADADAVADRSSLGTALDGEKKMDFIAESVADPQIVGLKPGETMAELRQRLIAMDDFDTDEDESSAETRPAIIGSIAERVPTIQEAFQNGHNIFISLAIAFAMFVLLKLMYWFKS